jgi:hypothetical protein
LARGMGSIGGCGDQSILFNGWDGYLKNLIKDWWRDHKLIIAGYGYFKTFETKKHTHTHTMKSLGPMTSWPMAINCQKKNKNWLPPHARNNLDLL